MSRFCSLEEAAHQEVGLLERRQVLVRALATLAVGAPVVLEEVEAPLGELPGVLRLVPVAPPE